ncbi:MAG: PA14 domain-containing protein [Pseudomonadota bacterium]|nr:PA14 domain-containing protein [Pseudomonadota bacterium]
MSVCRVLSVGFAIALLAGCQSWQYRQIQGKPAPASAPEVSEPGKVQVWYYDGISGNYVESTLASDAYPDSPDEITEITELQRTANRANNYGTLIRGYIQPPTTGEYTFYVAGDDQTQFWLSDSASEDGLSQIASTMSVPIGSYTRYSSQTSAIHYLEGGQKYYFELRHKEGGWDDHFSVAWEGPGISQQVISGGYLYTYARATETPEPELSEAEAYELGYRIGRFDASQGLAWNSQYRPLDKDGDNLYDNWEVVYGLDPGDPSDALSDTDNDLLSATEEFWARSDPSRSDTDGDGIPDGYEYAYNMDPADPADASQDLDGDGFTALNEYEASTNPTDPDDRPVIEASYLPGFTGQYFSGTNFDEFLYTQRDSAISLNWGSGSPSEAVPANRFSIRWTGRFLPPHEAGTREYQFTTVTDDGVRLFVNDNLVIDQWKNQSATPYSAAVSLSADDPVIITMEYYEYGGNASASLEIADVTTGSALSQSAVIRTLDTDSEGSTTVQSLEDGIPDSYKLQYGLPLLQPVSSQALNDAGITVMEAYQSGLHPYTLEAVAEPSAPQTQEPPPQENTAPPTTSPTLSWTAPGTRVDGASISLSEIAEYQIRYGKDPEALNQTLTAPADATSLMMEELDSGTWYFTIQVVDTNGLNSQPSEPVEYKVE